MPMLQRYVDGRLRLVKVRGVQIGADGCADCDAPVKGIMYTLNSCVSVRCSGRYVEAVEHGHGLPGALGDHRSGHWLPACPSRRSACASTALPCGDQSKKGSPETGVDRLRPVGSAEKGGAAEERRLGPEVDSRLLNGTGAVAGAQRPCV